MTETKRLADELEALARECAAFPEGPGHVNRMYDLGERALANLPLILSTLREAEGRDAIERARDDVVEQACEAVAGGPGEHTPLIEAVYRYYVASGDDEMAADLMADWFPDRLALSQGGGE